MVSSVVTQTILNVNLHYSVFSVTSCSFVDGFCVYGHITKPARVGICSFRRASMKILILKILEFDWTVTSTTEDMGIVF